MRACFHWRGTDEVSNETLITSATKPQIAGAASLKNQAGSLPLDYRVSPDNSSYYAKNHWTALKGTLQKCWLE